VPAVLKKADVRPLYKGGDQSEPKNYRPVSLLPVVSKILEKCVHRQLTAHLVQRNAFPDEQFAYRANHGTEDALVLSKAFDKVRHATLIEDL